MAMFRAMSSTKGRRGGYDKLLDETNNDIGVGVDVGGQDNAVLKRAISVPARALFGSTSRKLNSYYSSSETGSPAHNNSKSKDHQEKKKGGKVHPVFSLFDGKSWRKKKKLTANPDFSRYIEYLKEGGMWNKDTNSPVIHYK